MSAVTKRTDRFTETTIDEEIVVMHLGTGRFFSLTGTAALLWRLIDGTHDRSTLANEVTAIFDGRESDIASDVDDFLEQLEEAGLIAID